MAGDVGSLLIVGYSGLVMSSVWYLLIEMAAQPCILALFCGLVAGAVDDGRRWSSWIRSVDFASGAWATGCSFTRELRALLAGNRFSPDFARAEWSLASAGWFGRGTGLFVDANRGDPFAGYLAYGYNDRAIIALTETFGFTGLVLILAVYVALIVSLLAVYAQTFGDLNKLVGIALATAAIIFGQMVVHVGGNLWPASIHWNRAAICVARNAVGI